MEFLLPHACMHIHSLLNSAVAAKETGKGYHLMHACIHMSIHDRKVMFNASVVQPGNGKRASVLYFVLRCVGHKLSCCCLKLAAICWS